MKTPRTRLLAVSGTTLALIVAGTAVVSANHGGGRGDSAERGERGQIRQHRGDPIDDFIRRETMVLTEDGSTTRRVDNGTFSAATETSLDYTLATGETVSVAIDEDTHAVTVVAPAEADHIEGAPPPLPTEISVADIESESQIVVWAQSQDDGSFLAQRVMVRPVRAAEGDQAGDAADAEAAAIDSAAGLAA